MSLDYAAVTARLGDLLATVGGLTVRAGPVDTASPPTAMLPLPVEPISYRTQYGPGWRLVQPVVVIVSRVGDWQTSVTRIGAYLASVPAAVDSGTTADWDYASVDSADISAVEVAGTAFYVLDFSVEIAGT